MKKVKMLLMMSVVLAIALVAFVGCGGVTSPSSSHSHRIGGMTVVDFDIDTRTHAQFVAVQDAWADVIVHGDLNATNIARSNLEFRPSGVFGFGSASFEVNSMPTHARHHIDLNMYGETAWSRTGAGAIVGNEIGDDNGFRGFYVQQNHTHAASNQHGTVGVIQVYRRYFTYANIVAWFGLTPPEGVDDPDFWTTGTNLADRMNVRWNAVGQTGTAQQTQRAINRADMVRAMNENIVSRDMLDLGYSFINNIANNVASNPFTGFVITDVRETGAENAVLRVTHGTFPIYRHLRFTARAPRTYYDTGSIDYTSIERVVHVSRTASGIHNAVVSDAGAVLAGRGNIIVLANEHNHELLPVIRHTVRRNFEIEGVLVTRLTSTYVHGQLRTIDVQIRSQSTEGDGSYITTSASMSFLINRP